MVIFKLIVEPGTRCCRIVPIHKSINYLQWNKKWQLNNNTDNWIIFRLFLVNRTISRESAIDRNNYIKKMAKSKVVKYMAIVLVSLLINCNSADSASVSSRHHHQRLVRSSDTKAVVRTYLHTLTDYPSPSSLSIVRLWGHKSCDIRYVVQYCIRFPLRWLGWASSSAELRLASHFSINEHSLGIFQSR